MTEGFSPDTARAIIRDFTSRRTKDVSDELAIDRRTLELVRDRAELWLLQPDRKDAGLEILEILENEGHNE